MIKITKKLSKKIMKKLYLLRKKDIHLTRKLTPKDVKLQKNGGLTILINGNQLEKNGIGYTQEIIISS